MEEVVWNYRTLLKKVPVWVRTLDILERVCIEFCDVSEFKAGDFPLSLEMLHAKNQANGLSLYPDSFQGLVKMWQLDIGNNQIGDEDLSPGVFGDMDRLEFLFMGNNRLTKFDGSELGLATNESHNLELELYNCDITSVGGDSGFTFKGMDNLYKLKMQDNKITHVHADAFSGLSRLWLLAMQHNAIEFVHEEAFSDLDSIAMIQLEHNQLASVPANLLTNIASSVPDALQRIYLDHNRLETLPSGFLHNRTIGDPFNTIVTLDNNNIKSLPSDLFNEFSYVGELMLHNNALETLPEGIFDHLSWCTYVLLGNNSLEAIPDSLFGQMVRLDYLGMGNNKLTHVHEDSFKNNTLLAHVILGSNQLTSLPSDLFKNNADLKVIEFENNAISEIDENTFHGLSELADLRMHGNMMTELPEALFSGAMLDSLASLSIGDNPFTALPPGLLLNLPLLDSFNKSGVDIGLFEDNVLVGLHCDTVFGEGREIRAMCVAQNEAACQEVGVLSGEMEVVGWYHDPGVVCEDSPDNCQIWGEEGKCGVAHNASESGSVDMAVYCPVTCGLCGVHAQGYYPHEGPANAVDGNTFSKFGSNDGPGVGIRIGPVPGGARVKALRLVSAFDAPERDPASFRISGSTSMMGGYSVISEGQLGIFDGRFAAIEVDLVDTGLKDVHAFEFFEIVFPKVTGGGMMQIGELQLLEVECEV